MKKLLALALLFSSLTSFGGEMRREFDPSVEAVCHNELKSVGCVSEDDQENHSCAEKKISKLSTTCQKILWEKKGKSSN
jgi:hypothetical protein